MLYFLGLFAGFILANQSPINARLGDTVKSPFISSLISFTIGTIFLAVVYFVSGQHAANLIYTATANPWWIWFGGVIGVVYLTSNILMFPKIGAIQTIILPIVGQVLMGVIIDSFGLFGVRQVPISLIKISGVFILFIGIYIAVVLANKKVANKVSTTGAEQTTAILNMWRIWGVFVGSLSAIQQAINGHLGYLLDSAVASAVISFIIGTVIILIFILVREPHLLAKAMAMPLKNKPLWLLTGGILGSLFVFSTTFLVPKVGAGMTVTLGLTGSILGSMVVSQFGLWQSPKQQVTRMQVGGILFMIMGVVLIKFG
ncbi:MULTISPECIES: DMT family transporter [Leuconostoc gelidum group]|uniref:DMT family transporter n=1 Tax=Leuconostoc gelidum group TaxID=3016637 RepID=UPI00021937C8|nr:MULTISPECIES: DMT family transporter [Leuconostoc gelidum group]AFS40358.1 integral membrane protein [Leuconostoc gelidum JB7]MBZ5960846.1 DMT family transporter [Leuconostoc gasicomitatum]MBZ5991282.1 DMT family transporter [Leuconostoc gelidum subsp. gelidum]MBZ5994696.1 DMT family transporter [Leuconostoc gasicomitatum]MBZ6001340.1 DMT family transporter [Leuconostoc gelidum subsp. gelidum]